MSIKDYLVEKFVEMSGNYIGGREELDFEDSDLEDLFKGMSDQNLWKLVKQIKSIKEDRDNQLKDYEEMIEDTIIQSAVELMADDATQTDRDRERSVWVESRGEDKNEKIIEELNDWLQDKVDVEDYIWTYAYHVVYKGQLYLETFVSDEKFKKDHDVGDYFELRSDDSDIYELREYGETIGYLVEKKDKHSIHPPEDFIHFISDRAYQRESIEIEMDNEEEGEDEEKEVRNYTTRYGTSFLEPARSAYKTLDLMETILIMSRIVRSALYRIFQIEVGKSDRKETLKIIREVRRSIESKETFNKVEDLYRSEKSPMPINSNVYSPQRNGKGRIEVNEVGGNVDIKNIVDIEYFRNKLFAGLKIPKSFLGFAEEMPGNIGGGTSLTRLDIRYARTVKRIQSVLKHGIEEMCNFYLEVNEKKDKIGTFRVRMTQISSAEEAEKTDQLDSKVNSASNLNNLVDRSFDNLVDKKEFLLWLMEEVIGLEGMNDIILDDEEEDEDGEDNE